MPRFHVTSTRNRASIAVHGLDWRRMGAARGIAGSTSPEAGGIFLCGAEWDVDFFLRLNNTGGPVDVWQVDGVDADELLDNGNGFFYVPRPIDPAQVTLVRQDVSAQPMF